MALSIVSNQAASIATRQLEQSNNAATATAEKLSSGKRINSAKDDAAASAIAARLSAEVAGLQQASVNAGQASSLLQIADGAFQNVEDILTRAKALSVQAGSEQISDSERAFLDQEFSALKDEIDRIASDTEFNGTKLVSGGVEAQAGFSGSAATALTTGGNRLGLTGIGSTFGTTLANSASLKDFNVMGLNFTSGQSLNNAMGLTANQTATMIATGTLALNGGATAGMFTFTVSAENTAGTGLASVNFMGTLTAAQLTGSGNMVAQTTALKLMATGGAAGAVTDATVTLVLGSGVAVNGSTSGNIVVQGADSKDFTFKVGTGTSADEDEISVSIGGISTAALGVDGNNLLTKQAADNASDAVSSAIDSLQAKRSDVGAAQNRLDFAGQNVELTRENQEAARSELEDLNVAKAITEFSQQQLLVQAGTSTLSQANSLPQNLLQLFR